MDDQRFGAMIRAARIRRGWRQVDLASRAGVSDSTVSRIERGHLEGMQVTAIRAVAAALEIRVELLPRSRAADADRLLNARHAALMEAFLEWFDAFPGWERRPEFSFAHFGERGIIDIVGWNASEQALLEVELKTDVIDPGELLGTVDRRRRLGAAIVGALGWAPRTTSTLVVIGESDTNRRKVAAFGRTFEAALPDRIGDVRRYLRTPSLPIRGLIFFSNRHPGQVRDSFATARRVRRRSAPTSSR